MAGGTLSPLMSGNIGTGIAELRAVSPDNSFDICCFWLSDATEDDGRGLTTGEAGADT